MRNYAFKSDRRGRAKTSLISSVTKQHVYGYVNDAAKAKIELRLYPKFILFSTLSYFSQNKKISNNDSAISILSFIELSFIFNWLAYSE